MTTRRLTLLALAALTTIALGCVSPGPAGMAQFASSLNADELAPTPGVPDGVSYLAPLPETIPDSIRPSLALPYREPAYLYRATIVSIYDADTVTLDIDVGFNTTRRESVRLYGIDAPEVRGDERPDGIRARDWLRGKLPAGTKVVVRSIKDRTGKYGRYLAVLWGPMPTGAWQVNAGLVSQGYAEWAEY